MGSNRSTSRLRKVLGYARAEATKCGHGVVDARHLLIGLLRERDNLAAQVLRNRGATLDGARRTCRTTAFGAASGKRADVPTAGTLLTVAARLSKSLHDDHLGSQHVLLALANDKRGSAILKAAGTDPLDVRADLLALTGIACSASAAPRG